LFAPSSAVTRGLVYVGLFRFNETRFCKYLFTTATNMDVYQKVLSKVYEMTGDRDNIDVDMADLLKREGFYPSMNEILDKMGTEGWITPTARPTTVRITHWGVMAARKLGSSTPDAGQAVDRFANRLQAEVKEFVILVEEFNGKSTADNFSRIEKKLSDINEIAAKIKDHLS
jgi:hypothetical protein